MGNLGLYQDVTTFMKKVGGPAAAIAITAGAGYLVGRGAELGVVVGVKKVVAKVDLPMRRAARARDIAKRPVFLVRERADCGAGLILKPGQKFRVLQRIDENTVQIAVVGETQVAYAVSAKLLESTSDFFSTEA